MHAHRSAGHTVPSSDPPGHPLWSDRVRGLGVCDALQLQLEPGQLPWLLEALEELRGAHEQGLIEATAARAAMPESQRARQAAEGIARHGHELALLRAVRDAIAGEPDGEAVVSGPAPLLSAAVFGAARVAAEALMERVGERHPEHDAAAHQRLLDVAAAAHGWVLTLVALRRLEWFTFDVDPLAEPAVDPA